MRFHYVLFSAVFLKKIIPNFETGLPGEAYLKEHILIFLGISR